MTNDLAAQWEKYEGVTRYIAIEFVGGPRDGERINSKYPARPEILVPLSRMATWHPTYVPAMPSADIGVYRHDLSKPWQEEVVMICDWAVARAKFDLIEVTMRGRVPLYYVWEGER